MKRIATALIALSLLGSAEWTVGTELPVDDRKARTARKA